MASHPYSRHRTYPAGVALGEGEGWLVMAEDARIAEDHSNSVFLYLRDSTLEVKHVANFNTRFAGILPGSANEVVAVGDDGNVVVVSPDGRVNADVIPMDDRGPLWSGTVVAGRVVVVGMNRQVYCREPTGVWVPLDDGLPAAREWRETGFESVAGRTIANLYAVGWRGEIWQYDGARWTAVPSPTTDVLAGVCLAPDDSVYAVGENGALLRATNDHWTALRSECLEHLWFVACFRGKIYAANDAHLYQVNGAGAVEPIDPLGCPSYGRFSTCPEALWSIGEKAVLSFNGREWRQLA